MAEAVTFEGRVPEIRDAYAAGQVVVLCSITEGFPYTLIEAMTCGRPCVATDVGGVTEAVGDTGLVVPPRQPAELARGLPDPAARRGHAQAAGRRRPAARPGVLHGGPGDQRFRRDLHVPRRGPAAAGRDLGGCAGHDRLARRPRHGPAAAGSPRRSRPAVAAPPAAVPAEPGPGEQVPVTTGRPAAARRPVLVSQAPAAQVQLARSLMSPPHPNPSSSQAGGSPLEAPDERRRHSHPAAGPSGGRRRHRRHPQAALDRRHRRPRRRSPWPRCARSSARSASPRWTRWRSPARWSSTGMSDQAVRERYGYSDVFALASEMYMQVPRQPAEPPPPPDPWQVARLAAAAARPAVRAAGGLLPGRRRAAGRAGRCTPR